jgi:hypothetical protein
MTSNRKRGEGLSWTIAPTEEEEVEELLSPLMEAVRAHF